MSSKIDLERRLQQESEKVKVLEDLVAKMETEIERSTMSVKSGSDRMSVDIPHETEDEEEDESSNESAGRKHASMQPGSPIQTLFAEMASMDNIEDSEEDDDDQHESTRSESVQSRVSSSRLSSVSLPSISVAQVLQSLRETEEVIELEDRGVQTETLHILPLIRVLSPTPPLTNAPIIPANDYIDIETTDQGTQTEIPMTSQAIQTDAPVPEDTLSPISTGRKGAMSPTLTSPILRPQNSIRRGSHTVRWQEDKSIQAVVESVSSVEIAIQTDPFMLTRLLKPVLKTPTSEQPEIDGEKVRLERVKSYDGPRRDGGTAKVGPTRRFEAGNRGSILFGPSTVAPSGHSHEKRVSTSHSILHGHSRKVSSSQSHNDLRRGRPIHPGWMKPGKSSSTKDARPPPTMQLHTPINLSPSANNVPPPLPIPTRSSSKYRVVLPIVRDRSTQEESSLAEVAEEPDDSDEEERKRREVNAFLARPPRKTVRQIRSAVTLRPESSKDSVPPTPTRLSHDNSLTSHTPSNSPLELQPKAFSTPRRQPKRLVKLRPPTQDTTVSSVSPASSYFPTSEEMTVVDEIARCMVGEYMYKYVRRRRRGSFTWRRSPARSPNLTEELEESTVRHKRWVWLQPYEK